MSNDTLREPEVADNLERRELARVRSGELRIIGKQSKRKHRKQGDRVYWSGGLGSYVWEPRK